MQSLPPVVFCWRHLGCLGNGLELGQGRFRLDLRNNFFPAGAVEAVPGGAVLSKTPCQSLFKAAALPQPLSRVGAAPPAPGRSLPFAAQHPMQQPRGTWFAQSIEKMGPKEENPLHTPTGRLLPGHCALCSSRDLPAQPRPPPCTQDPAPKTLLPHCSRRALWLMRRILSQGLSTQPGHQGRAVCGGLVTVAACPAGLRTFCLKG